MKKLIALFFCLLLSGFGCSHGNFNDPISNSNSTSQGTVTSSNYLQLGQDLNWGVYNLEIARDGSYANAVPNREASGEWGFHLNVVKFLEVDPCTDCLRLSNVHLTSEGDVSVDITIQHPWPSYNKYCTGFDVMGIIMFPASQLYPDPDLYELLNDPPIYTDWDHRWSSSNKGDTELMNPDGWTSIFAPDNQHPKEQDLDEGQPIFGYYPGKFASGSDLGTINAFKRYYSTETRHMFEAGKTVSRTYIIRPPASGPIEASYAIYAHWAPPVNMPVINPATDFGPEANSPFPYEFYITQDSPIDPDHLGDPGTPEEFKIHWHMKLWNDYFKSDWLAAMSDPVFILSESGLPLPHPDGVPDDYAFTNGVEGSFEYEGYKRVQEDVPDFLPDSLVYIFKIHIRNPDTPGPNTLLSMGYYLFDVAIEAPDGQ